MAIVSQICRRPVLQRIISSLHVSLFPSSVFLGVIVQHLPGRQTLLNSGHLSIINELQEHRPEEPCGEKQDDNLSVILAFLPKCRCLIGCLSPESRDVNWQRNASLRFKQLRRQFFGLQLSLG